MKLLLVNLSVCSDKAIHVYEEVESYVGLFFICVYLFQPVLCHLARPRGIYRRCTIDPIYQFTFKFLSRYLDLTFWSVTEFNSGLNISNKGVS